MSRAFLLLALTLVIAPPALAAPPRCPDDGEGGACVWGRVEGYDATGLQVRGLRVTLLGIAAPNRRDICLAKATGKEFDCGQPARKRIGELVAKAGVACEIMDAVGDALLARCRVADGDLAHLLVQAGLVRGKDGPYDDAATAAILAKKGLWAADMVLPKDLESARSKAERAADRDK